MYAAFYCHCYSDFIGYNFIWSFGYLVIMLLGRILPLSGFLGAKPISGVQRGHSAPSVEPTTTLSEACSYSEL